MSTGWITATICRSPLHVCMAFSESNDHSLKTLELSFDDPQMPANSCCYKPGQFCLLSVIGKGECCSSNRRAAWEGDFVRLHRPKDGLCLQLLCMNSKPGDTIRHPRTLGNGFPLEDGKGKKHGHHRRRCAFSNPQCPDQNLHNPSNRGDLWQNARHLRHPQPPGCA